MRKANDVPCDGCEKKGCEFNECGPSRYPKDDPNPRTPQRRSPQNGSNNARRHNELILALAGSAGSQSMDRTPLPDLSSGPQFSSDVVLTTPLSLELETTIPTEIQIADEINRSYLNGYVEGYCDVIWGLQSQGLLLN